MVNGSSGDDVTQAILGFPAQFTVTDSAGQVIIQEGGIITHKVIVAARAAGVLPALIQSVQNAALVAAPPLPVPEPPVIAEHAMPTAAVPPQPKAPISLPANLGPYQELARKFWLPALGAVVLLGGGYYAVQKIQVARREASDAKALAQTPPVVETGAQAVDGTEIFTKQCAGCHGLQAQGGTTAPSLKLASTWSPSSFGTAIREGLIPEGRVLSTAMPRFQHDDDAASAIQTYVKGLIAAGETNSAEASSSATSTAALSTPSDTAITEAEAQGLVQQYLSASSQTDLAGAINLYADQVNYFDKGVKSKAEVYDDKHAYITRWPNRSYSLDSGIATLSSGGDSRQVRFDYTYRVSRPGQETSGRAYTVLDLRKVAGQVLIVGENGKVYRDTATPSASSGFSSSVSSSAVSSASGAAAPKFSQWYFTTCQDPDSGERRTGLLAGKAYLCDLVIETVPNGAEPVSAVFNYELEYTDAGGMPQKFRVDAPDRWPASSGSIARLRKEGDKLIFTLPLKVRVRSDRRYTSINATGEIVFGNGSTKRVYEPLPVQ